MRRAPSPHLLDLLLLIAAAWAVVAPSRAVVLLAVAMAMVSLGAPRRGAGPVRRKVPAHTPRVVAARAPSGPGRPAVVGLPARRPPARAAVSVATLAGEGFVRPLRPSELPAGRVRVAGPGPRHRVDGALVAAGWELATRTSARRVDAVAVRLGLAADAPRPVWATEPDPLLLAATWPRNALAA